MIEGEAQSFEELERTRILALLSKHRVDYSEWGQGATKSVERLLSEVIEGESVITENKKGELVRTINVLWCTIYYEENGIRQKLVEEKQVFSNGSERVRSFSKSSISEKMKPGEDPEAALTRAFSEELGIDNGYRVVGGPYIDQGSESNKSYPGLRTETNRWGFDVLLDNSSYNPEGYEEKQSDKITYFKWIPST